MMNGMEGFGMGFGWILWLVIIGLVVWAVTKFLNSSQNNSAPTGERPIEIAKRRYAAGEINKAEFDELKNNLI